VKVFAALLPLCSARFYLRLSLMPREYVHPADILTAGGAPKGDGLEICNPLCRSASSSM